MKTITLAATLLLFARLSFGQDLTVPGVDFADTPSTLYVPAHQMAAVMGANLELIGTHLVFNSTVTPDVRNLFDGTRLVALHDLSAIGAIISWDPALEVATVSYHGKKIAVRRGNKHAEVNKRVQQLRAFQGDLLVLATHVSTGRKGHGTPSGDFVAGHKERMHYSRLYDDSPMPWAVQVDGNVFIHGYTHVPRFPASHGCIRVPLSGRNPARYFWHWVSEGTPVTIGNAWSTPMPEASVKSADSPRG